MPTQNENIVELFRLVRESSANLASTNITVANLAGAVKVLTEQNDRFFKLVYRVGGFMGFTLLICLAALIYGAVGKDGLHSVRQTIPLMREALPMSTNSHQPITEPVAK